MVNKLLFSGTLHGAQLGLELGDRGHRRAQLRCAEREEQRYQERRRLSGDAASRSPHARTKVVNEARKLQVAKSKNGAGGTPARVPGELGNGRGRW